MAEVGFSRNFLCLLLERIWTNQGFGERSIKVVIIVLGERSIRVILCIQDKSRPYWPSSPSNGYLYVNESRGLVIQRWGDADNVQYGDVHR